MSALRLDERAGSLLIAIDDGVSARRCGVLSRSIRVWLSAARSVTLDRRGIIGPVFLYARLEVTPTIGVIRSLRFLQAAFEDRDAKHCTGQSGLAGMGNHIAE